MAQRIPRVVDGVITPRAPSGGAGTTIAVGSPAWYAWLDGAATRAYAFGGPGGTVTARRERQHGSSSWYAYGTRQGRRRKAYLGTPGDLTPARLDGVAAALAATEPPLPAAPPAAPTGATHDETLLATKLFVPPPRPDLVARHRLDAALAAGMQRKLTLLAAPAGSGKTTLLARSVRKTHLAPKSVLRRLSVVAAQ